MLQELCATTSVEICFLNLRQPLFDRTDILGVLNPLTGREGTTYRWKLVQLTNCLPSNVFNSRLIAERWQLALLHDATAVLEKFLSRNRAARQRSVVPRQTMLESASANGIVNYTCPRENVRSNCRRMPSRLYSSQAVPRYSLFGIDRK